MSLQGNVHIGIETILWAPTSLQVGRNVYIGKYYKIQCDGVIRNAVSAPRLSAWLEDNLYEGLTVFDFPLEHQRTIWTANSLERINKEIRRRTRVVGVFPNEVSCLRLISALLMEISEEWQIGKRYCAGKSMNY